MSDLESLVTGNLVGEEEQKEIFRALPPMRIYEENERAPKEAVLKLCQDFPAAAEKNPSAAPYLVAQIALYTRYTVSLHGTRQNSALYLLALAGTYAKRPSKKILGELAAWSKAIEIAYEEKERQRLEKIAIGNTVSQLDFLREFFGDNLASELAEITRVKKPTARKWVEGGNMSWRNSQKISILARIFYALQNRKDMDAADSLSWYHAPTKKGGSSPRDLLKSYMYAPPTELRQLLHDLGSRQS